MRIANGIEMLEITATVMGKTDTINPTLLWDEHHAVLVDTGYPGQMSKIAEAMEQAGVPLAKLNKIVMTHQDLDHIGSLPALQQELSGRLEVMSSELERPYIQGDKQLLKLSKESIAKALQAIPPEVPEEWRRSFQKSLENPPKGNVDRTVTDGEVLPYCGGIIVIDTPGHTPGHISLYHKPSKTLIAADAMIVADGQLYGAHPQYSLDPHTAALSLRKLLNYEIESVICYHGGLFSGGANERIAELVSK
ncbi:MBL fold metallo-hydrolase [Paenibacillus piri]|uniref:MBL fold metallo-hydrolase n=1 Tax=Paenibacillus piri TaxID=2547395 RepID=A0A4R5KDY0_9BACL|nr:MBL fold metallo-hydrolase [Paenibacillus piri]TDF92330.1 MBL fold metallo-hydrolase [Paenibacillus piri]